jgi:hypothetical protein
VAQVEQMALLAELELLVTELILEVAVLLQSALPALAVQQTEQ